MGGLSITSAVRSSWALPSPRGDRGPILDRCLMFCALRKCLGGGLSIGKEEDWLNEWQGDPGLSKLKICKAGALRLGFYIVRTRDTG